MNRKLQVFVSSTFVDLKEERQAAVGGILLAGHIPAGMELFTAGDETQLEVIRRWIRDCDAYMLILGARYGSIEPKRGLGYTELEYDYAVEISKPLFAVVMSGPLFDARKADQDQVEPPEARAKYGAFRAKVLSKMSFPFENTDQIKLGILGSLRDIADRSSASGWVKASEVSSVQPLVEEIAKLQAERDDLKAQIAQRPVVSVQGRELAGLDDKLTLRILYKYQARASITTLPVSTTWGEVFAIAAPLLYEFPNDNRVSQTVAKALFKRANPLNANSLPYDIDLEGDDWGTVKFQFEALGLVTYKFLQSTGGTMYLYWYATEAGKQMAVSMRSVYRT